MMSYSRKYNYGKSSVHNVLYNNFQWLHRWYEVFVNVWDKISYHWRCGLELGWTGKEHRVTSCCVDEEAGNPCFLSPPTWRSNEGLSILMSIPRRAETFSIGTRFFALSRWSLFINSGRRNWPAEIYHMLLLLVLTLNVTRTQSIKNHILITALR